MGRNDHYWAGREDRACAAREHTASVAKSRASQTATSVAATIVYESAVLHQTTHPFASTQITVEDSDSVSAIFRYAQGAKRIAVLNFASFKNPGGAFLDGSQAQEECLCHASNLYNILAEFQKTFYAENLTILNRSLYQNRGLYSPNVVFELNGETCKCDVITVAAPNKYAAQKYHAVSNSENLSVLYSRIRFVLDMAADQHPDVLVLGAFGCGVFGQNPIEVASVFKRYLENEFDGCFKRVVFAVPSGKNGNLDAFKKVFRPENKTEGSEN